MRFGVQTVGSEGDVRPLVALAAGLRATGHEVSVSICGDSRVNYRPLCQSLDLRLVDSPLGLDFSSIADTLSCKSGAEWSREFHRLLFVDNRREDSMYDIATSMCAENDVLISHYLCYPAKAAVAKTGVPHVSVQLTYEHTPTQYRPSRIDMPDLGQRLNQISWQELFRAAETGLKQPYMQFWNSKGLPPFEHLWSLYFSDDLNLLGVSELFCPQQPDWDGLHVVTGFLNLPPSASAPRLSERMEEFLDAGEPPVFMTFGSAAEIYPGSDVEQNIQLFIDAATAADCRAVIQTSGADASKYPRDTRCATNDRILFTDWISYDKMFDRSAAVVHHGGIGTCQLSLKRNCPSVLVPFTDHHATFAHEMHQLKICPKPVMRSAATATHMAAQIRQVLSNSAYRQQAAAAGAKLRSEDGVIRAVEVISERFDPKMTNLARFS